MTLEEKGAYMELLMMQFNRGHMTTDMIAQTIGQLWVKVQDKFVQDSDGLWYNVRLDAEKEKRQIYVSSRQNNKNGKNQYSKKVGHMTSHMENENINGISINKGAVEKFNHDEFFSDGQAAFLEIQSDELLVERLVRVVQQAGNKSCDPMRVMIAVKKFLTIESAKEEFTIKPKKQVKNHLVNWTASKWKEI